MPVLKIPSDLKYVRKASEEVLNSLRDLKLDPSTLFDLRLCFEEALINAIRYGNKENARLTVEVEVKKSKDGVEIVVKDKGGGFDFINSADPTTEENLTKLHGRGIFLIKNLMDKAVFENNGSCLRMIKKIKRGG